MLELFQSSQGVQIEEERIISPLKFPGLLLPLGEYVQEFVELVAPTPPPVLTRASLPGNWKTPSRQD
jgi:hypothetical protein